MVTNHKGTLINLRFIGIRGELSIFTFLFVNLKLILKLHLVDRRMSGRGKRKERKTKGKEEKEDGQGSLLKLCWVSV